MVKTVLICEECQRSKSAGRYFTLTYTPAGESATHSIELCGEGCLVRRISKLLPFAETLTVARTEVATTQLALDGNEATPLLLTAFAAG